MPSDQTTGQLHRLAVPRGDSDPSVAMASSYLDPGLSRRYLHGALIGYLIVQDIDIPLTLQSQFHEAVV